MHHDNDDDKDDDGCHHHQHRDHHHPILITIMTKGNDLKKLPEVIKEASNLVYNQIQTIQTTSK